jgi:hypothetical protein
MDLGMPVVENPDGTLWIDVDDIAEVGAVRKQLTELGVRVSALVPGPTSDVAVEEAEWSDLYPRIVPRNGPEPGIIVQPTDIPEEHALLLGAHTLRGIEQGPKVVLVLSLIRGTAPRCNGKVISRSLPGSSDPRLRPARPPRSST